MKYLSLLFALILWAPQYSGAQEKSETVSLRFLFLDESPGDYFVKQSGNFTSLGATPYVISPAFEFKPGSQLQLYKQLPSVEEKEPVRTLVVNLAVNTSTSRALVVVAPSNAVGSDGTHTYKTHFYDVSPEKTPARSIRILNLSPSLMAARFGADEVQVAPGEDKVITPSPDKRSRIRTYVATHGTGEWKMLFNSFLSLGENTRMTGIVVYSPSGLRHTYTQDELDVMGPPKPGFFWLSFTETIPAATP